MFDSFRSKLYYSRKYMIEIYYFFRFKLEITFTREVFLVDNYKVNTLIGAKTWLKKENKFKYKV